MLLLFRACARVQSVRKYATLAPTYGQPLHQSHPHLVARGELTPGIQAAQYEQRRAELMDALPDDSLVVSIAAPIKYVSNKIFYKYRQHSDFWYLTGVEEPESAVILEKIPSLRGYRMTLFLRGKNAREEKWEGSRTGHTDAVRLFAADRALPTSSFSSHLRSLFPRYSHLYMDQPELPPSILFPGALSAQARRTKVLKYLPGFAPRTDAEFVFDMLKSDKRRDLAPEVGAMRTIKSESEQKIMRAAADISAKAHTKTIRFARPGISEAALAAHFEYICALEGSQRPAYVPVVASGRNALTIHYTSNDHILKEGDLVLVDAGCEYNGYASDITRTYPVSGKFTEPQAKLYSAVLSVQKALIALCTPSSGHSLASIHKKSVELLGQELVKVGFKLSFGDLEGYLYEHYVGHSIGIDLHESAYFSKMEPFKEGMVITIEPGVYVPAAPKFPDQYHNIGIRIEDEVLVTRNGPVVLSAHAPKEIADVEGACQGLLGLEPY